jgi:hypothetical protein
MTLFKFAESKGAAAIPADALDANFARLKPLLQDGDSAQYRVTETPNGWQLNIFPPVPSGAGPFLLGIVAGRIAWIATTECEE